MNSSPVTIFWFRRDFRLEDNASLFNALKETEPVQPVFIFDSEILDKLPRKDARVEFIHQEIMRLSEELRALGADLDVRVGKPIDVWKQLTAEYQVNAVWANRDYEPYARERDKAIYDFLEAKGIPFKAKKDHVIFEKDEVVKKDGKPYTVYTPYSRLWKATLTDLHLEPHPSETVSHWHQRTPINAPPLACLSYTPDPAAE